MGWHCITVWECELKPSKREETLDSIAFTLNHIYLQDHSVPKPYEPMEEEIGMPMAAEADVWWKKYEGRCKKEDVWERGGTNVLDEFCKGLTIFAKNSGTKIRSVHYFFCTFVLPNRLVANGWVWNKTIRGTGTLIHAKELYQLTCLSWFFQPRKDILPRVGMMHSML